MSFWENLISAERLHSSLLVLWGCDWIGALPSQSSPSISLVDIPGHPGVLGKYLPCVPADLIVLSVDVNVESFGRFLGVVVYQEPLR